ncbi:MAG: hypothetical protein KBS62_00985 [Oscillospiraceae bacterium]|nr:hypothetical protein [Candidatus Ruminococcus equi]
MMRKRDKILNELHQEHFVEKYCKSIWEFPNAYEYEEAVGFVWLDICSIHPKRLCEWYTQGGLYKVQQIVSGIIQREIKSQNSPYHYRVRKKKGVEVPISHLSDYTKRGL